MIAKWLGLRSPTSYKNIHELEAALNRQSLRESVHAHRRNYKIAVIDDKDFTPRRPLEHHGYQFELYRDIHDFREVHDFSIILCDLLGVGRRLGGRGQGAHLIKEIKRSYPDKFVIAYTGGYDPEIGPLAVTHADRYLKKDADIEQWCDILDEAVEARINPVHAWRRIRIRLVQNDIVPIALAELEDRYVRATLAKDCSQLQHLLSANTQIEIPDDVRSVINSLIANLIFDFIKTQ